MRVAIECQDIDGVYEMLHKSGVDNMLTTPRIVGEVTEHLLQTMSVDELLSKVTKIADWMFDCIKMPSKVVISKNIKNLVLVVSAIARVLKG